LLVIVANNDGLKVPLSGENRPMQTLSRGNGQQIGDRERREFRMCRPDPAEKSDSRLGTEFGNVEEKGEAKALA
jgi:hypothetical protein